MTADRNFDRAAAEAVDKTGRTADTGPDRAAVDTAAGRAGKADTIPDTAAGKGPDKTDTTGSAADRTAAPTAWKRRNWGRNLHFPHPCRNMDRTFSTLLDGNPFSKNKPVPCILYFIITHFDSKCNDKILSFRLGKMKHLFLLASVQSSCYDKNEKNRY